MRMHISASNKTDLVSLSFGDLFKMFKQLV